MNIFTVLSTFIYFLGLQIHKVPSTDMEALKSPLMGLFEKRRAGKFFLYVQDYKENDPSTHKGYNLTKLTTKELISWVPISLICLFNNFYIFITRMKLGICLYNLNF
jgi:Rab GDP dissociation inhibitor